MLLLSVSVLFIYFMSVFFLNSVDPNYMDEKEE